MTTTIPPLSTKRTIGYHLSTLNTKTTYNIWRCIPCLDLGQVQQCGEVKPLLEM